MKYIIPKDSTLYWFLQRAFFPLVLVGTPYIIESELITIHLFGCGFNLMYENPEGIERE